MSKLIKDFVNAIREYDKRKTSAYDTVATVKRIDGDTAWVHIPSGIDETPVKLTVNASKGDSVQVRVGGGRAWITGNHTAPPTDDKVAKAARIRANEAYGVADEAIIEVNKANKKINENAEKFASDVLQINSDIENLQDQVDGNITTWFYTVDPSLTNPPASEWIEDGKEDVHLGDLYYNTVYGYVWRWQYVNNAYSWGRISDTDVTKALADAAKAQDTADSKRRVFYATPTVPYDLGDLWVQGSSGDILRCSTAKTKDESYAQTDWILASKYTDDSFANKYLTVISGTTGISVHSEGDNKNFVNMNADDGVTVYRDINGTATDVTNFGETVRIGRENSQQVNLDGKKLLFKSDANTPTMLLTPPSLQAFSATSIKEVAISGALAEGELVAVILPPSNATLTELGSVKFRILSGTYNVDVSISHYDNKPTFSSSNRSTWFYYYTDDEQQYVYIESNGTWTPTSGTYRFSASCFFTKEVNLMAIGCHPYFKNDSNLHAKYKYAFVVGTGRSDTMPENALEVRNDGRTLISTSQELLAAISSLGWEDDCLVDELTETSTFYTLNGLINSL